MNILILNWRDPKNPKSGGAEIVTLEHAKAWIAAGHQVVWFTSLFPQAKRREKIAGVEIIRRGSSLGVYLLASFFYFFSGRKFDRVVDEIHGIPFLTPFYVRVPKIAFIHEVAGDIWDYMYPFPINKIGKFFENIYFRFYRSIPFWTDAPSTIDELAQKGLRREQCTAIACPITTFPLVHLPEKEEQPTYIFVSRLVKMKGIEDVITAFTQIYKTDVESQLWLVGSGDEAYLQKLKEKVKREGLERNVTFWGYVSEEKKLELMRGAHLLLHASVKEGWGLVVLEAASQGTPAVVYDVPGLRDVVKDGSTGVVVKKNVPSVLAKEAQELLLDLKAYRTYQKNGLEWVKSLTWDTVTKQSLKLLTEL